MRKLARFFIAVIFLLGFTPTNLLALEHMSGLPFDGGGSFDHGCSLNTLTTPLPETDPPTIISTTPGSRCGTGSVQLSAVASSGVLNWFTVPSGGTVVGTGSPFLTPSMSSSTTYYVEANDMGSISVRVPVQAMVNPIPVISAGIITDPAICSGANGSIEINGTGTGTVSWSGAMSGNATNITLPHTITGLVAGNYSVDFTEICVSNTVSSTLYNPPPATIALDMSTDPTTCLGADGSITVNGLTSTGTITWTGTNNGTASITDTMYTITGLQQGTYAISFDDGCLSNPLSAVLSDPPIPTPPVVTVLNDCGTSTLMATGTNLFWTSGHILNVITVSEAGTYTVTQTVDGCTSAPTIAVAAPLDVTIPAITAGGPVNFCEGGSVELISSLSNGNVWSTSETTSSISVTNSGTYTVSYTETNGCVGTSDPIEVNVFAIPSVSMLPFDTVWLCVDDQPILLTGGIPLGGTYTGVGVNSGDFDPLVAGVGAHAITYSYQDANGCENTATEIIMVDDCLGVSVPESTNVRVYPNPSNGLVYVETNYPEIQLVKLMDEAGRLIDLMDGSSNKAVLDISNRANGIYTLEVHANNHVVRTRIIKN